MPSKLFSNFFLFYLHLYKKKILDNPDDDTEQDGSNMDQDKNRGKAVVIKTSTRQVSEFTDIPNEYISMNLKDYLLLFLKIDNLSTCCWSC